MGCLEMRISSRVFVFLILCIIPWGSLAIEDFRQAFPIVEPDPGHTKLRLSREGLEAIERITNPIAAVAVIGPYRSGKSFLLNQLLSLSCYEGFGVGHMRDTKTKGIWVWGTPLELMIDGVKTSVFYLDTEGFESVGKSNVYDDRIFALATVLSSVLIYNLPETIREADISRLSFAVELAEEFYGRINLTFWDELAHVAFQHVQKGNQIYVSGRLVADLVEPDDGKQQTYYKVIVQQLNFIERSNSTAPHYDQDSNSVMAGRKLGSGAVDNMGSTQELWQAFFANPVDWWDNRKNKKNPKYPDFKHKDTGEALWVEGRYNPPWVKSQLAILDMRMGSLDEQEAKMANFVTNFDFPSY